MPRPDDLILAREVQPSELARSAARGELRRIRTGAYTGDRDTARTPQERARRRRVLLAHAVHRQLRAGHTFSHVTAAALWGCALWRAPDRTHLVQAYRPSSRAAPDLARHIGVVPTQEQVEIDGLPVTDLGRTLVDCAVTIHPLDALVIADSALGRWPSLDLDRARSLLDARGRVNGSRRARWVLDHVDGGADSPGESWVRYICLRAGLPRPRTQAPVVTAGRTYHCDLGWQEHGVYVEFDGRVKYTDGGVRPGHDATQELLREKRRADALHEAGVLPVRVMSGESVTGVGEKVLSRFPAGVRRQVRPLRFLPAP
ncbi:hypothetical protein [Isoptericola aurantiacus]|uniref:hypothetical protein n=1 Tax=Isoptericola aurantiacus TaxID=3377839 RepID=UPI00383A07DD